jgi:hypothetical protein
MMAPLPVQPQANQLLSAAPVHSHAEPLRRHPAAVVEGPARAPCFGDELARCGDPRPHDRLQRRPVLIRPRGTLTATAAIAADDIWAVGAGKLSSTRGEATLIEHRDGTS